jgi:hypothetical protein
MHHFLARSITSTGLLVAAIFGIDCPKLSASTLYDTFGPGLTADDGYATGCAASTCIEATPFVPAFTAQLGTVVADLGTGETGLSPLNQYSFSIWTDVNGSPGAMLESWSVNAPGLALANFTLTSVVEPTLLSGVQYWALYSSTFPSQTNTSLDWGFDSSAPPGGVWVGPSSSSLEQTDASFSVPALLLSGVEPVPEPGTLSYACAALVVLAGYLRRRRR